MEVARRWPEGPVRLAARAAGGPWLFLVFSLLLLSFPELPSVTAADVVTEESSAPSQQPTAGRGSSSDLMNGVVVEEEGAGPPVAASGVVPNDQPLSVVMQDEDGEGVDVEGEEVEVEEEDIDETTTETGIAGVTKAIIRDNKALLSAFALVVLLFLGASWGSAALKGKPPAEPARKAFQHQLQQLMDDASGLSEAVGTLEAEKEAAAARGHLTAAEKLLEKESDRAALKALHKKCMPQTKAAVQALTRLQRAARAEGVVAVKKMDGIPVFEGWPDVLWESAKENECALAASRALKGYEENSHQVLQQARELAKLMQEGKDLTDVSDAMKFQATKIELVRLRALGEVNHIFADAHQELESSALNSVKAVTVAERSEEQKMMAMEIDQLNAMCRIFTELSFSGRLEETLKGLLPLVQRNLRDAAGLLQQHAGIHQQLVSSQNTDHVADLTMKAIQLEDQLNILLDSTWEIVNTVRNHRDVRGLVFPAAHEALVAHIKAAEETVRAGRAAALEAVQVLEQAIVERFKGGSLVSPALARALLSDLKGVRRMAEEAVVDFDTSASLLGRQLRIASPGRGKDFVKSEEHAQTALANAIYMDRLNQELDLLRIELDVIIGFDDDIGGSIDIVERATEGVANCSPETAAQVSLLMTKFRSIVEEVGPSKSLPHIAGLASELRSIALVVSDLVFNEDRSKLLKEKS